MNKEEEEDDVTFLEPCVVINMDNYKPYKDIHDLRAKSKKYLLSLIDNEFSLEETNPGVVFKVSTSSIKHVLSKAGETKLIITKQIEQIFKQGFIYQVEDAKQMNEKNVESILKCRTYISVEGKIYECRFVIKMYKNDNYFYDATIDIKTPE